MKCVLTALVLLLAATSCPAVEDPLESLNTVEDTLNAMSQQRCNQRAQQRNGDAAPSVQLYRGDGDDSGSSPAAPQPPDDASCTSSAPDTAR